MEALEYAKSFIKDVDYKFAIVLEKNITLTETDREQIAYVYRFVFLDSKRLRNQAEFWLSFILGDDGKVLQTILRDHYGKEIEIITNAVIEAYLARNADAPLGNQYYSTMIVGH